MAVHSERYTQHRRTKLQYLAGNQRRAPLKALGLPVDSELDLRNIDIDNVPSPVPSGTSPLDYNIRSRRSDAGDDNNSADLASAHDPNDWQISSSSDGKTLSETRFSSDGDAIATIDYAIGDDGIEHIKISSYGDGALEKQQDVFTNGTTAIKYLDTKNTHPYSQLEIDEDASGKVTAAKPKIDGQPSNTVDFSAVGQVLGSALGRALAPNNQFGQIAVGTVAGAIGQKLAQAFSGSLLTNAAQVDFSSAFANFDISLAGAGAGSVASFLTAELGHALGLTGFNSELFNASIGSLASGVANKIATEMLSNGLSFEAAIGTINFGSAAISAGYSISGAIGGYLGRELVPAQTHEGAVGGQLLGAVGSAVGISVALSNVIGTALGSVLNFIVPGIGSLIGTIVGTLIGDAIGSHPHPAAVDVIDQAGYLYGYSHSSVSASDGGDYGAPDKMAVATDAIINAYLSAVKGAALDHSKQTMVGYVTDPDFRYINGWAPTHQYLSFISPDDAVHAAALDVLQHLEVIGGDLLLKRAHQNSPSNIPQPVPWALTTSSSQSGAEQLATLSGDLSVAQDYENYLNNREAINALMAANPNTAFTAGWIATFARVNELGLNHANASDFLGGLVGYLDSVAKAGLGAAAANATVKRGGDGSVIVELKVAGGVEVPGALSVFADHIAIAGDGGGQTIQFTVDGGVVASGFHFLGAGAPGGDGANDFWIGGAGGVTFNGTGGHDILVGGAGNDTIRGGAGFDFIDGGAGNDQLFGEDGNDILRGGRGNDGLYGGGGNDTYGFTRGDGFDVVLDDYHAMVRDDTGGAPSSGATYHDEHLDGGADSLVFGVGISLSDLVVGSDGADLIVGVKDPAHPNTPFGQLTDIVTLQRWMDADGKDRIEKFVFADGTVLNVAAGMAAFAPYQVPFGEALSGNSVAENAAIGTVVGTVTGFDLATTSLNYSLVNDAGPFAINASTGVITVANSALLDYEAARSHTITVRTADQTGHVFDNPFIIAVTNVNEAPIDATLAGGAVAENAANGTVVGTVTGLDPDAGASLHYSLTWDAGGRFAINAATGVITVANGALLDYEAARSHIVTVRTADQAGLTLDTNWSLSVTNVNERPIDATLAGGSDRGRRRARRGARPAAAHRGDRRRPAVEAGARDGIARSKPTRVAADSCHRRSGWRHPRGPLPTWLAFGRSARNPSASQLGCIQVNCA
jgi:Ca2+-binding RTX toxin-like protein